METKYTTQIDMLQNKSWCNHDLSETQESTSIVYVFN